MPEVEAIDYHSWSRLDSEANKVKSLLADGARGLLVSQRNMKIFLIKVDTKSKSLSEFAGPIMSTFESFISSPW